MTAPHLLAVAIAPSCALFIVGCIRACVRIHRSSFANRPDAGGHGGRATRPPHGGAHSPQPSTARPAATFTGATR